MKKSMFWGLIFLMMPLAGMGHTVAFDNKKAQWEVYRTQSNPGHKGNVYKVKGRISSFKREDMKGNIKNQHILTTEDRRSIDLEASGVDVSQIKKFVQGKPVEVFFKGIKTKQGFLEATAKFIPDERDYFGNSAR